MLGCLSAFAAPAQESAESAAAWQLTPRVEHSRVVVNGNDGRWDTWSLSLERATAPGELVRASIGRQDRNGVTDNEVHLAAHGRFGDWNASASVQMSPDPVFLPEWGYQVQVDRAAGVRSRAGAGYRRLQFNESNVHLWSTQMTFYRGNDELGIDYRFGRNAVLDHDIGVLQLRAVAFRGANQFGVYLAHGDYLFDALGVPGGAGEGWSANLAFARVLTPSTSVRWELGAGAEEDAFRQRTVAVSVHYRP